MGFAEGKHSGVTVHAARAVQSQNGTLGVGLTFVNDEGDSIDTTVWLTEKTVRKADKENGIKAGISRLSLEALGFDAENPAHRKAGWDVLLGAKADITVEREERDYNGKHYSDLKVKWINKPGSGGKMLEGGEAVTAASMRLFGQPSECRHVGTPCTKPEECSCGCATCEDALPF
jgi:hypothetical protein